MAKKVIRALPDYNSVDYGFLISRDELHFACTVQDMATGAFISRYFRREKLTGPWFLVEQHQCLNEETADDWTENIVPNPQQPDTHPEEFVSGIGRPLSETIKKLPVLDELTGKDLRDWAIGFLDSLGDDHAVKGGSEEHKQVAIAQAILKTLKSFRE